MMQRRYQWLSEKDRRRCAAVEAAKPGHGGLQYISQVLDCGPKTIQQGRVELEQRDDPDAGGVRSGSRYGDKKRGGCKPRIEVGPHVEENPDRSGQMLQEHPAGDPRREGLKWTDLTRRGISHELAERGTPVSVGDSARRAGKRGAKHCSRSMVTSNARRGKSRRWGHVKFLPKWNYRAVPAPT